MTELPRARGADLLDPASYTDALAGASTVVHCAAATGKASPRDHFRVNVDGTRLLLEQCARHGVRRFVFVSTIAVTFPDIRQYPYALAKRDAERLVRDSGLDFTIVRPTIVAGRGAPVLAGLAKLAGLPRVPVFGPGTARVQPILVDDLVEGLAIVAAEGVGSGQTIELGGPEVVTIEALLGAMHRYLRGTRPRAIHLPLPPVLASLGVLELFARRFLPVTVGQLSTFRFDGVARPHALFERLRPTMTGLDQMIAQSLAA